MKLTKLLKEVQEERSKSYMSVDLEFETDAHGNLEIWSGDHEEQLAVVDRKRHLIDYSGPWQGTHLPDTVIAAIEAAAQRFLDDESDPSDPTAMYADRFSDKKRSALGKKAFGRRGDDDDQGMQTEELDNDDVKIDSAVDWLENKIDDLLELYPSDREKVNEVIEQAKQMESEQKDKAYNEGFADGKLSVAFADRHRKL